MDLPCGSQKAVLVQPSEGFCTNQLMALGLLHVFVHIIRCIEVFVVISRSEEPSGALKWVCMEDSTAAHQPFPVKYSTGGCVSRTRLLGIYANLFYK